jgi:Isochorismatase family
MADQLAPFPLTERSVHLCVDVQRIFSADGLWPTPWMQRVLPVITALARLHPERSVFTRFVPPVRPEHMPGMWQRYYTRWRAATRAYLDLRLLELMPPLAALCPPATVIDKSRYSGFAEPRLLAHLQERQADAPMSPDQKPMYACWLRFSERSILVIVLLWCGTRCAVHPTKVMTCSCAYTTRGSPSRSRRPMPRRFCLAGNDPGCPSCRPVMRQD